MLTNQFSRDNHYIPQFYLKQWANNELRVWEYRLLVSHENVPMWQSASVKGSIGWQRDLYTGIIHNIETDEIEHWYEREIEHPAQYTIEKIENGELLNKSELAILIRFVAAQYVRTPAAYFRAKTVFENSANNGINKNLSQLTRKSASYLSQPCVSERPREHTKWFPIKLDLDQSCNENGMINLQITTGFTRNTWHFLNQTLLNYTYHCLLDHDWHIIKAPPGVNLYTNDDPVAFMSFYDEGRYDFKGGWGRNLGNAFFPISPNYFLFTEIGRQLENQEINGMIFRLAYWMQRISIENAFRSIYSTSKNQNIITCRQRIVSKEAFVQEKAVWSEWNRTQYEVEQEFN